MAMAMLDRRTLLGVTGAVGLAVGLRWLSEADPRVSRSFEIEKTDGEWRRILSKAQYEVLRLHRTEIPGSSPLNHEKRKGIFACAACDLPLFSWETKYDSGTGWPSFFRPLDNALGTATDYVLLMPRTEVHCRRCGGHLGHRFEDGPPPTGLRYCINGVALTFKPDLPKAA
jgi:peptide-methionine (R)-S-oxide reductase